MAYTTHTFEIDDPRVTAVIKEAERKGHYAEINPEGSDQAESKIDIRVHRPDRVAPLTSRKW